MSCDCDYPKFYQSKLVKVRKEHRCCECDTLIKKQEQAEKVDALWDAKFSTIYTCKDCVKVREKLKETFSEQEDTLCCHGELYEFLWSSDLLWDEDEIEEEASQWIQTYDDSIGVIRGANSVIGVKVDWLKWSEGRLVLVS